MRPVTLQGNGRRILVLEDDPSVQTLILKQLMITPTALGMEIAKAVCLRPKPVLALLQDMKQRKLVQHRLQAAGQLSGGVVRLVVERAGIGPGLAAVEGFVDAAGAVVVDHGVAG